MGIVYLCEDNCTVHKNGAGLLVKKGGYRLDTIPLADVDCIVVFGNSQLSSQALSLLFEKGIDMVYMSRTGKIRGRLNSEKSSNVILRIAQYNKWQEAERCLSLSKEFVSAKIANQLFVLEKYKRYTGKKEIDFFIDSVSENKEKIIGARNTAELMGVEGICARYYFNCYTHLLGNIGFTGRARRPAYDPVNALLNLSYAFLKNEIHSWLNLYSFDTELGFLHGIRYGRSSLSLDLMEEFRPCFIDEFVIILFNKSIFRENDFEIGQEGCFLKYDALKKYCSLYQEHLKKPMQNGETWKAILDRQVLCLRRSLLEGLPYRAYRTGNQAAFIP